MLYLYSLLNLSSVMRLNDFLQKATASSIERPKTYSRCWPDITAIVRNILTLRNKPYCKRPKCFKWLSLCRASCNVRMHIGKCFFASPSTMSALISSVLVPTPVAHSEEIPAKKPFDRFSRMGIIRVSSSKRGSSLDVSYKSTSGQNIFITEQMMLTSNAFSN